MFQYPFLLSLEVFIFLIIGTKLRRLKIIKIPNKIEINMNGIYRGGKATRSNNITELINIPIPKLKRSEGIITNKFSVNNIRLSDLFLVPIALIIRKSFAFSIIPPF